MLAGVPSLQGLAGGSFPPLHFSVRAAHRFCVCARVHLAGCVLGVVVVAQLAGKKRKNRILLPAIFLFVFILFVTS